MLKKILHSIVLLSALVILSIPIIITTQYFFPNPVLSQAIQQVMGIAARDTSTTPNRWRWLTVDGSDNLNVTLGTRLDATNDSVSTLVVGGIDEGGLLELIGIDDQIAQNEYGDSIELIFTTDPSSGQFKEICLYATEDDAGVIIAEDGRVIVFDADPTISAGDTAMSAAEAITILAEFALAGSDYQTDANQGHNCQAANETFHSLTSVFLVYFQEGATTWNSGATDDEQLQVNLWLQRKS